MEVSVINKCKFVLSTRMPRLRLPKDEEEKNRLQQSLNEIVTSIAPSSDGGLKLLKGSWHEIELCEFALSIQMAGLFPAISDIDRLGHVVRAVKSLVLDDKELPTIDKLINIISLALNKEGRSTIRVTTFLDLHQSKAPETLELNGTSFQQCEKFDWLRFTEHSAIKHHLSNLTSDYEQILQNFTSYSYEVDIPNYKLSNSLSNAFEDLSLPFEQLRSLLNFIVDFGKISYRNSIRPLPYAPFTASPCWFFEQNSNICEEFMYEPTTLFPWNMHRQKSLNKKNLDEFSEYAAKLTANKGSTATIIELIWKLLDIYQKALYVVEPSSRFIHYWQIIERTVSPLQKGRGIESKAIISRLDNLFTLSNAEKSVLGELAQIRHAFAHVGEFPHMHGDYHVRIIKRYADKCIYWLIQNEGPLIQTLQDLEAVYVLSTQKAERYLEAYDNALKFIRKSL